jgi:Holliday junction resolvasome RuvABC endonuclease subunit
VIVLGLDSATTTGYALVEHARGRDRLIEAGTVDGSDGMAVAELAGRVVNAHAIELVAIEDNFLGKNPATLKVMARIVGRWQQAFEPLGVDTDLIEPSRWRSVLRGFIQPGAQRAACKDAAQRFARMVLGAKDLGTDAAEAACLAVFAARRAAFAARVKSDD